MIRPGHHRPLGTIRRMRFVEWSQERQPALGDIACQVSGEGEDDSGILLRAYRVVGIEEGRTPSNFGLLMQRVEYGTLPESLDPEAIWSFYNLPRGK